MSAAILAAAAASAVAQGLPRAYEMVSPLEKNGFGVVANYSPDTAGTGSITSAGFQLASDGDGLVFESTGALPGSESAPGYMRYVARRSSSDWSTTPLDPPVLSDTTFLRTQLTFAMSDDMERALVFSNVALAPGAVAGQSNLYVRDVANGSYELVATHPGLENWGEQLSILRLNDVSEDLRTILFTSAAQLTPDAPQVVNPYGTNLFQWRSGEGLRVVGVDAAGTPLEAGGRVASYDWAGRSMSPDGRRVLFLPGDSTSEAPIYLREDDEPVVPVSASQRAGDDPAEAQPATFFGASADLRFIFFASQTPLTDVSHDAPSGSDGESTLYRYDADTGTLIDLLAAYSPEERVLRWNAQGPVSADGSTVTFAAGGQLAPGGNPDPASQNIYMWRDGELSYVGDSGAPGFPPLSNQALSSSGRYLAFSQRVSLTSYVSEGPACLGNYAPVCRQVYVYDEEADELSCASCDPTGAAPAGGATLRFIQLPGFAHQPNVITDDGMVGFDASDPLVPADVNGRRDVYTWQDGEVELITTGKGDHDAVFAGMSEDGSTIAFGTQQRLVGRDTDDLIDAYVARRGGGLTAQGAAPPPAPECQASECQGPHTPPARLVGPASGSLTNPARRADRARGARIAGLSAALARGVVARLRVRVSGPGEIVVSGGKVARSRKAVGRAGTYVVRVRLRPRQARGVRRGGKARARVRVAFEPRRGDASSRQTVLRFDKSADPKGGR